MCCFAQWIGLRGVAPDGHWRGGCLGVECACLSLACLSLAAASGASEARYGSYGGVFREAEVSAVERDGILSPAWHRHQVRSVAGVAESGGAGESGEGRDEACDSGGEGRSRQDHRCRSCSPGDQRRATSHNVPLWLLRVQYYASTGLRTCLLIQSQDPTADVLLGQKLGSAPASFRNGALTAFRLETTKMILEPLAQIKSADARQNFSQGALDEIKGEELSVLPGMDPILAMGAIERLTGFTGGLFKGVGKKDEKQYDVVVYDGLSSDDIFRMFGSAERARWYVSRFRSIAEKTDVGRVSLPSVLRLMESAFLDESKGTSRSTNEIWEATNRILQRVVETFQDPQRFACFLVTNPGNTISVDTALRYWGCATQAGIHVAGALYPFSSAKATPADAEVAKKFVPLSVAGLPFVSFASPPNWEEALGQLSQDAKGVLSGTSQAGSIPAPVTFNQAARTVTLFLPGFQKSDIKLLQLRGGSELLVEAGDQRRSVVLPPAMRGKVAGAKFLEKSLVVTIKAV